jgi:glutamate-5-semialdehyde dehydrogenase
MKEQSEKLSRLEPGTLMLVGGDRVFRVSQELAERFNPGDSLLPVTGLNEVLHLPYAQKRMSDQAVARATQAFRAMAGVKVEQSALFYEAFARRLADDSIWKRVAQSNEADVRSAQARGRSTTRLIADQRMRQSMIEGLLAWQALGSRRGEVLSKVEHSDFMVEVVAAELGVVGFVFEGRPNVLADATGVLQGGNTVVFRIGRDALGSARTLMECALAPSLADAGLPKDAVVLLDSPEHAAGWALVSNPGLALAVVRGSGVAVQTLGALAKQAGVQVSLHGRGGAWMVATAHADANLFEQAVQRSLDRKVCNTLNTCCIERQACEALVPKLLAALDKAGSQRQQAFKLHVAKDSKEALPAYLFSQAIQVSRSGGHVEEMQAQVIDDDQLGHEWEWEQTPEMTFKVVGNLGEAVDLFNAHSPQFVATLISEDAAEHDTFYRNVNAPFVGDAHTRWVDGQYALKKPELGLSNWESGRLLGRPGILSGDTVFSLRTRYRSIK